MARGDFTLFNALARDIGLGVHDLNATDTLKFAILKDDTPVPVATQTDPTWTTYSAREVDEFEGTYVAGGKTLTTVIYTLSTNVATLDADDVSIAQDALGFTSGYWAILYNDTAGSDQAIGFIQLKDDSDNPVNQVLGDLNFNWNASGIFKTTRVL